MQGKKMNKNKEENIVYGMDPIRPIPENESLGKLILEKLKLNGNNTCMIDPIQGQEITFSWLLEKSIRAAESLRAMGIKGDDVISISSENHLNFFVPILAATYLGIAIAPVNHNYTAQEFLHCMSISKPKVIFCNSNIVEKILKFAKKAPYLQHIITLDSDVKIFNVENFEEFLSRSAPITDPQGWNKLVSCKPKDQLCLLLSSSGTTGLPKGVELTQLSILTYLLYHEDSRIFFASMEDGPITNLGLLPFFHAYGLIMVFSSIIMGYRVVVLKKFEDKLFLQVIQDYKISALSLVPPILVFLAKSPLVSKYDLSSVKVIGCGAAPLSKDIQEAVMKRLNIDVIRQGYGLTESTLGVMVSPIQHPLSAKKIGSSGILLPYLKCKVADLDTGKALGPNQRGELCFKGPLVMRGYRGNAEATAATFDGDGWLHTGDVGYYDEDKFFYIVDRIKELIKYKGFQVAPAELESLLLNHPSIKDAAVIGIPDEEAGELPLAFVVKQPGKELTGKEVQQYVAGQVSKSKRLYGGVIFLDDIPKNPSGKILRRKLRDMMQRKSKL